MANNVRRDGRWVKSATTGPAVPTLFERCRQAGRSSVAIMGDQYLVGVCGARAADVHWPPDGVLPPDAARGITGYGADRAVVDAAANIDLDVDFVFVQLDEVDSVRHVHGAFGEEARTQCHSTDAALGAVFDLVRHRWDNSVICVVSDHDQEDLSTQDPIDLSPLLDEGLDFQTQGTAALIVGPGADAPVADIAGIAGSLRLDGEHLIVWGDGGRGFGPTPSAMRADHGSPRTRGQLAAVGGGHPRAADIASRLRGRRPRASDWAGWISELLELDRRPD
jgi:hypothetical protein